MIKLFFRNKILFIFPVLLICLTIYAVIEISPYLSIKKVSQEQLLANNISQYDNLMIVAHPDDETLFGGDHIKNGNYFIVCITSGNNSTRKEEFEEVLEKTGCGGIILSYPDKLFCLRSHWTFWKDAIKEDISYIVSYKNWESIVTHNKDGEYGHIQHKLLHSIVEGCVVPGLCDFYTFGKYYKKADIPDDLKSLDDSAVKEKKELLRIYNSQSKTIKKLSHMIPYENWEVYSR